ncbi:MAG: exo-alpha-sialidase [Bacteroidales bacterium]|nr:exo-alpha-sialidase [Bacteroidales bacterium]
MKRPLVLISVLCIVIACDRFPDPSYELLRNFSFIYQNQQGQRFLAGEWVNDSVSILSYNYATNVSEQIRVVFEVVKGGGSVTSTEIITNSHGIASTKWQLGFGSTDQILRAKSYDMSGKYLTSTDLLAYGFRLGEWDKWSGDPDGHMTDMVADTVNKVTFMIAASTVYRPGDRYYLWETVPDPLLTSVRTLDIDGNGIIYGSTWTGEIIKSTDHGETWRACTKPYPDRPYYIYMSVSNDNWLWVFDFDHPTRYSSDGGETWTDAGDGIESIGSGDVFRLKDGSLLIHGSNCCSLNRSYDDGLTWTPVVTPGYSLKLYVNEDDDIYIVTQEPGISIYRSTDYAATFNKVHTVYPEWGTSMENTFSKWGSNYYITIPGYGILKSADLINYEDFYLNSDILNLFIDQNGVMIAQGQSYNSVYYLKAK